MRIALIGDENRYVASGPGGVTWSFFNFRITMVAREVSFLNLPHSAFSTPARYLMELARRVTLAGGPSAGPLLLFNPLFGIEQNAVGSVLARAAGLSDVASPVVFADAEERPIAYLLPAGGVQADYLLLSVLSTVNAALDLDLLKFLGRGSPLLESMARLHVDRGLHNGFYDGNYFHIYEWVADVARRSLTSGQRQSTLSIYAYMPHHAGDVLFFALAMRASHDPSVGGIAVNMAYQPIVQAILPGFEAIPLDVPAMNRGQVTLKEWDYFQASESLLPHDRCYYYLRPVRDYDASNFHLIDQYAFALGHPCESPANLPSLAPKSTPVLTFPDGGGSFRVLLHFNGGWPLKIYPKPRQESLVELLTSRGYQVTVLDGDFPLPCRMERFSDLAGLSHLLSNHHLVIGMDSFPVHYAAHILGIPSICLYSSTQPANSDAPAARHYRALERNLTCRPCRAISTCPLNGSNVCSNFVAPETVVTQMESLLAEAYPPPFTH